jgi:hypothetical protein
MTKGIYILSIILAMESFAFSQNPKSNAKPTSGLTHSLSATNKHQSHNPKADQLADKIITALKLNDIEAKQVRVLCTERAEKIEKIRLNSDTTQQKITDLQAVNAEFEGHLKAHFTAAQYAKYEQIK